MRLLETWRKTVVEFQRDIPSYAILSHVWGEEEVTFQDFATPNKASKMYGFAKIFSACEKAKEDGFRYIWIDTCCINKESSIELSEAINSMYTWYKNAEVCYVYLSDVLDDGNHEDSHSLFAMSHWFTRGWTLQELIAPWKVVFFTKDWVDIGTKSTLREAISARTGISMELLLGELALDDVPVAVRMSWAADRNTTREEDIAYSLMGIFDIQMPLLYGEGRKAFIRLQHEIIKKSNDHSIFAWTTEVDEHRGILARSPNEYRNSGMVERIPPASHPGYGNHLSYTPRPYSITNHGLHIELPIVVISRHKERETLAFLNCRLSGKSSPIIITLLRPPSLHSSEYVRSKTSSLERREQEWQVPRNLSPLYIVDDHPTNNPNPGRKWAPKNQWLHCKVPTEYGEPRIKSIDAINSKVIGSENREPSKYRSMHPITSLEVDYWVILVFYEPAKHERFAIIVCWEAKARWCDVLMDLHEDEDGQKVLDSYNPASGSCWTRKKHLQDRASSNLADGWSATIQFLKKHATIEVKKSKQRDLLLPKQPNQGSWSCLVIPPVMFKANLQSKSHRGHWVQHLDCFVFYSHIGHTRGILAFKDSQLREFSLLVRLPGEKEEGHNTSTVPLTNNLSSESIVSGIMKEQPEDLDTTRKDHKNDKNAGSDSDHSDHRIETKYQRHKGKTSYIAHLGDGTAVFVTVKRGGSTSMFDYIVNLSADWDPYRVGEWPTW